MPCEQALAQRFLDNVIVRESRGPVDSQINSKAASLQAIAAYLRLLARQQCPWQSQSLLLSAVVQTVVRSVSEGSSNANSDILDKFGDSVISELCKASFAHNSLGEREGEWRRNETVPCFLFETIMYSWSQPRPTYLRP